MRLVTRQEIIDSAPREWAEQYSGPINYGEDKTIVMHKLQALIPPYTREAIDMAIGNGCWTTNVARIAKRSCDLAANQTGKFVGKTSVQPVLPKL